MPCLRISTSRGVRFQGLVVLGKLVTVYGAVDDASENELWIPHGVTFPDGLQYPPARAHSVSCFMRMCSLSEILNQILVHIYGNAGRRTGMKKAECVRIQGQKMQRWWDELPSFLKLAAHDLPPYCPPSHIVTLKYVVWPHITRSPPNVHLQLTFPSCLYHTTNILLHRHILCSRPDRHQRQQDHDANPLIQCITSATSIIALYDLYRRTFGDAHVVLSIAYSLYTASSIFLLEIQALKYAEPGTMHKLKYCIIAMENAKTASPGMTRSSSRVVIIYYTISLLT